MPLTFTLPQTAYEALVMFVPFATVLLGLFYLTMPAKMLKSAGLRAAPEHPEAIGEGRATYAGALLAFGLCCLLLQEPRALQPGLNTMLSIAWLVSGLAFLVQIVLEKRRRKADFARLALALLFAVIAWMAASSVSFGFNMPRTGQDWIFAAIGGFTLMLGVIGLLRPRLALKIMRLQIIGDSAVCICGPRGILGGFYVAAGLGVLIITEPVVASLWLQMLLGAVWMFTGLGRIVAMVFDPALFRGFTKYNIFGTIFELGIGFYVFAAVFGVI